DRAQGAAGEVRVIASREIRFSGVRADSAFDEAEPSGVFSGTEGAASGAGGSTFVSAPLIILSDEAEIGSETFNASDAAGLRIEGGELRLSGGAEITTTGRSTGAAGSITIDMTGPVTISEGAEIASRSDGGAGAAGVIDLSAGDLTIESGGRIATDSDAADGGSIRINARDLVFVRDGAVTTSVGASDGDGGDVTISGDLIVLGAGATLAATADEGDGGFVTLNAGTSFFDAAASIEVGSNLGADGSVVITGTVGDQSSETEAPPAEFLNRFALVDDFCVAAVTGGSALTIEAPAGGVGADAAPALFGAAIPFPGGDQSKRAPIRRSRALPPRCGAIADR
ncbi:MAG: hypothetical protein AAFU55_05780, partial [Pseudomonadota bacterium]